MLRERGATNQSMQYEPIYFYLVVNIEKNMPTCYQLLDEGFIDNFYFVTNIFPISSIEHTFLYNRMYMCLYLAFKIIMIGRRKVKHN